MKNYDIPSPNLFPANRKGIFCQDVKYKESLIPSLSQPKIVSLSKSIKYFDIQS